MWNYIIIGSTLTLQMPSTCSQWYLRNILLLSWFILCMPFFSLLIQDVSTTTSPVSSSSIYEFVSSSHNLTLYRIWLQRNTSMLPLKLSSIVLEIPIDAYTTWSKSDWLFVTQSRVLQADWSILGNYENATLNINMPYSCSLELNNMIARTSTKQNIISNANKVRRVKP